MPNEPAGWILVDADTGNVLDGRATRTPHLPASTIKLFTALVAIQRLPADDPVPVSAHAAGMPARRIVMAPGQVWDLEDLLVSMLTVWLRAMLGLQGLVTERHLNMLDILTLATGLMTGYGYVAEVLTSAWAGSYELQTLVDRFTGPYAWSFWGAVFFNFGPLQLLWWKRIRTSPIPLFVIATCAAVGMWFERYMLVVSSLYRDWLESSEGLFHATFWDWSVYAGTLGLFLTLFLLFIRFLPVLSAFEVEEAASE